MNRRQRNKASKKWIRRHGGILKTFFAAYDELLRWRYEHALDAWTFTRIDRGGSLSEVGPK